MALIDRAGDTSPTSATRALHVAMYTARIARAMSLKTPARDLWVLGTLSVLAPMTTAVIFRKHHDTLSVFASQSRVQMLDVHADILKVAHAFEDGVEQSARTHGETSPAEALRMMMRDRMTYAPLVVAGLRRALAHPSHSLWTTPAAQAA